MTGCCSCGKSILVRGHSLLIAQDARFTVCLFVCLSVRLSPSLAHLAQYVKQSF
jgi:hypothetical protein